MVLFHAAVFKGKRLLETL